MKILKVLNIKHTFYNLSKTKTIYKENSFVISYFETIERFFPSSIAFAGM